MEKHEELLKLYRVYIDNCIENTTEKDPIYPMSFVKWVGAIYIPMKDSIKKILEDQNAKKILRSSGIGSGQNAESQG